jgi:ribokinase
MAKQYDFVAIGDIVTDAFIRLAVADEHMDHKTREICMPFATKIPFESVTEVVAVGNCANAAYSAARLGLSAALISNQGDDEIGKKQRAKLMEEHVGDEFVRDHVGYKSNYHYVLWYKDERTILVKHEDYPYVMPDIGEPRWLYLTSLGAKSLDFHKQIAEYLSAHPGINLVFQPGTFQIKLGMQLADLYKRAKIFFCNVEEAREILGVSAAVASEGDSREREVLELMKALRNLGPEIVCVTDGPAGAYALDGRTNEAWYMPPYPDETPPVDRTGAGDAFASTFTSAIALGKSVPEALAWAPINSMSVVHYVGAREGLLSRAKLEEYLASAPETYKPRSL